jgi:heat shock protein HtpX
MLVFGPPTMLVRRRLAPLDPAERRRHKIRNAVQSVLLLGGMVVLLGLCGWLLFGPEGMLGMAIGTGLALAFSPRVSPQMVLRMYRAIEIRPHQLPEVVAVVERLAERAGLPRPPRLYYVPSAVMNAFAVGSRDDAAIAVTDGLLRRLTLRELAGVLAHEISHVRNNDLWIMGLADLVGRLTRLMTFLGLLLVIVALPAWLVGAAAGPPLLLLILLLMLAPQIALLLQLALSRAREFDADLDAAGLTGDPAGLASALVKLERWQRGVWEQILMPGWRLPEPSILRTHPPTAQRLARLEALYDRRSEQFEPLALAPAAHLDPTWPRIATRPRPRLIGFWY